MNELVRKNATRLMKHHLLTGSNKIAPEHIMVNINSHDELKHKCVSKAIEPFVPSHTNTITKLFCICKY